MILSRVMRPNWSTLGGLALAASVWLLATAPVRAQSSTSLAANKSWPWLVRTSNRVARAPAPVVVPVAVPSFGVRTVVPPPMVPETPISVAISTPVEPSPTAYVDIRGPNGEMRRFALAGGADSIQPRTVFVRAGDTITVRFASQTSAR